MADNKKVDVVLRQLTLADEAAFFQGLADWPEADREWHTFVWQPGMSFAEHCRILERNARGEGLPQGRVPSSMLYGFVGDRIVGRVSIRHQLSPALMERGGHIGYAVAPVFRQRGYAASMVSQALPICRALGLSRLLITCDDGNLASIKIIEGIGGQLEGRVWFEADETFVRRYWAAL